jgi:hypothetical protein
VDVSVTHLAEDQRFALTRRHNLDPQRPVGLSLPPQILERPHVMDLDIHLRAAKLTGMCQEPPFEFCPWPADV